MSDLPSNPPRNTPDLAATRDQAAPGNEPIGTERAGSGGAKDNGAGDPGGTLGTGGRREQDQ